MYKYRTKKLNKLSIDCPKHGVQKTYFLLKSKNDKKEGLGCCKCFEALTLLDKKKFKVYN